MIYLAQTDTTAGFLSKNKAEINLAKKRNINQECIMTSCYFAYLKQIAKVSSTHKNKVRRAKKTTFIHKNGVSLRIIKFSQHADFLKSFIFLYSSSANLHGEDFNINYAKKIANIVIDNEFSQNHSSKMIKLSKKRIIKIR